MEVVRRGRGRLAFEEEVEEVVEVEEVEEEVVVVVEEVVEEEVGIGTELTLVDDDDMVTLAVVFGATVNRVEAGAAVVCGSGVNRSVPVVTCVVVVVVIEITLVVLPLPVPLH